MKNSNKVNFENKNPHSQFESATYNGKNSRWYQPALQQKAGRTTAAGMTEEVSFEPVDGEIDDEIDDAYKSQYKNSAYLSPLISARGRAATLKVIRVLGHSMSKEGNAPSGATHVCCRFPGRFLAVKASHPINYSVSLVAIAEVPFTKRPVIHQPDFRRLRPQVPISSHGKLSESSPGAKRICPAGMCDASHHWQLIE